MRLNRNNMFSVNIFSRSYWYGVLLMFYDLVNGEDTFARGGDNVTLMCPFSGSTTWSKGTLIINQGIDINPAIPNTEKISIVQTSAGNLNLHITSVTFMDAGQYDCAVGSFSKRINLNLYVNPNAPSVQNSIKQGSRIEGVEGQVLTITCNSKGGNPPADVTWMRGQTVLATGKDSVSYTWIPSRADDRINCICQSNSAALVSPLSKTVQLYLSLKPSQPVLTVTSVNENNVILDVRYRPRILIQPSRLKAIVGDLNVQLMCSVSETNPGVQSYIWTKGTQTLTGQGSQTYIIPNVSRSDNGTYRCQAVNIVGTSETASAVLEVIYAPVIAPLLDQFPEEGTGLQVTCSISASNPNPNSIYWTRDNDANFRVNSATLTITSVNRTQADVYICHAENTMVSSTGVSRTGTSQQTMTVHVLYGPGNSIGLSPSNRTIAMEERESNIIPIVSCSAICNPLCKYSWSGPSPSSTGQLTLGKSERKKNGTYTCTTSNTINGQQRQTKIQLDILIYYKAEIKSIEVLGGPVHNEGTEVSISCATDSYPAAQITWTSSGHRQLFTEIANHSNMFRLSKVSCYDTANYTCTAFNGFGTSVFKRASLFIQCSPRLPEDTADTVHISISTGENLNISATFIAYPRPNIQWYFKENGTDILLPTQPSIEENDLNLFQSILVKELKDELDFGIYIVKASNKISLSQSYQKFIVEHKRAPDPPINESVTCKDKVTVSWTSAFNGGADQEFTVYYGEGSPTVPSSKVPDTNNKGKVLSTTIEKLTPGNLYFFKVRATNLYGSSETDYPVNCTTAYAKKTQDGDFHAKIYLAAFGSCALLVASIVTLFIVIRRRENLKRACNRCVAESINENNTYESVHREMSEKQLYSSLTFTNNKMSSKSDEKSVYVNTTIDNT